MTKLFAYNIIISKIITYLTKITQGGGSQSFRITFSTKNFRKEGVQMKYNLKLHLILLFCSLMLISITYPMSVYANGTDIVRKSGNFIYDTENYYFEDIDVDFTLKNTSTLLIRFKYQVNDASNYLPSSNIYTYLYKDMDENSMYYRDLQNIGSWNLLINNNGKSEILEKTIKLNPGKYLFSINPHNLSHLSGNIPFNLEITDVTPYYTSISIPSSVTLKANSTRKLNVSNVVPQNGVSSIRWSSSNKNVATVSSNGTITGQKKGVCTVTAALKNGKTFSCKVNIINPNAYLNHKTLSLYTGNQQTIKLLYSTGKTVWKSDNKKLATVSSRGRITAKKAGYVKITAKNSGKKYTCKLTVKEFKPKLNSDSIELFKNQTFKLKITNSTKKTKWSSSDTSIASVSSKGNVTAKGDGTAWITAKVNSKTVTCKVTCNTKRKYGNIYGKVSYKYNSYIGNTKDSESIVILIPTSGVATQLNTHNLAEWYHGYGKLYKKYDIFMAEVDYDDGSYSFNNVPEGEYVIMFISGNTTSGDAFKNLKSYQREISNNFIGYLNSKSANDLAESVMYKKYSCSYTDIQPGKTTKENCNFGISYN